MKIISWNVNGIKSAYQSGDLQKLVKNENPDILCIQEIKTVEVLTLEGYVLYTSGNFSTISFKTSIVSSDILNSYIQTIIKICTIGKMAFFQH